MKNNTKLTYKIFWQHIRQHKILLAVLILTITLATTFGNIAVPWYLKKFLDALVSQAGTANIRQTLIGILLMILALESISWVMWRIATFTNNYFQPKIMSDLLNTCFAYVQKHSSNFFDSTFVGSLVKKVTRFSYAFEEIADRVIWNLLPLVVNSALIFIVLARRSYLLGLIIFVWITAFLTLNWLLTKFKLKYDILRSKAETKTSGILADTITNQSNIKFFVGYDQEVKNFNAATEEVRELRKFTWDIGAFIESFQGIFMIVLEIGIYYFAIGLWVKGVLTAGDFVLIQAFLINIFMRVWDFGRILRSIYERLADAEEMTIILNTPHEIVDARDAKELKITKGKIEFKKVKFNYYETREVISGFNLVVKSKEKVALVGHSGVGKSTIIKLLLRVHDVASGSILIDDQSISKVSLKSLWQNISFVPQEPILFHRTLNENIRYGKSDATDAEVIKAAKLAHCHEFIMEFPDQYNTYVGERGVKLSSGERQRVAIARAILKNAPILVLDEATSSLDSESEQLIKQALDNLMQSKTVMVIAHRLSTIMKMDRIVLIDQGRITEEGTHQELLKRKDSLYKKLWEIQVGGFID